MKFNDKENLQEIIKDKNPNYLQKTLKTLFYYSSGIIAILLLWFIIGKAIIQKPEYAQFVGFLPLNTFKALFTLIIDNNFWISVVQSLNRIIIGIMLASILGIPLGILIGFYKKIKDITNIPIQFIRMISPLAWMPIAIILLPTFNHAIFFLICIATIWPIVLNTSAGVLNVHKEWIKMAKNQGATDRQLMFKVIFPASIPYILTGFRLAIGVAWIVLVPAEFLGVSKGLGYLINDARDTIEYDRLMAVVIAIGLIGFLIDGLFQILLNKFDWRKK